MRVLGLALGLVPPVLVPVLPQQEAQAQFASPVLVHTTLDERKKLRPFLAFVFASLGLQAARLHPSTVLLWEGHPPPF
jgi:hypothetical protein